MSKTYLLDCTLRDGGYINDWNFGEEAIKGTIQKLVQTGIEMIEVGFIKGRTYVPDKSIFPDIESFKNVIGIKKNNVMYLGMIDMGHPVSIDKICPYDGTSIDGIRVIFKKSKMNEAYDYIQSIIELGYKVFVNFVSTDSYTDKEFIEGIEKFNALKPYGVTIVDTFGTIKRKNFRRMVDIADHNLDRDIMLCYHAHNNLQQAFGNAEAFVEMNLKRDICVDACVFGMGRGAGNLNLELFAEYMNDNYDTHYSIKPMLHIMDEYLADFYKTKFWGYSLPLYLSASHDCHPNYAIYLAEKNTLSVSAFDGLLQSISEEDKAVYTKDKADQYYNDYLRRQIDDKDTIAVLKQTFFDKHILVIGPGKSVVEYQDDIKKYLATREKTIVVSINYYNEQLKSDYIFVSNMRRLKKIKDKGNAQVITTSNIHECNNADYVINYKSSNCPYKEIVDNGGLMLLRLLSSLQVKDITIAGMDGYSSKIGDNYYTQSFEIYQYRDLDEINKWISEELKEINKTCNLNFITPTLYRL